MFLLVGFFRRISVARVHAIYVDAGDWFLAGCGVAVVHVWFDPHQKRRRGVARAFGGGGDWLLLLFDVAAYGKLVVRRGISRGVDWGETFVYSVPDSGTIFPGHLLKSSFMGRDG